MSLERKEPNKAHQIANGLKNVLKSELGLSSEEDERIFSARREVCNSCVFRNKDLDSCEVCGCFLPVKIKSLISECPKELW